MRLLNRLRKRYKEKGVFVEAILFLLTIYVYLNLLALCFLFSGCDVDDDRDLCCERVRLIYRYVRKDRDEYTSHIKQMQHFLFKKNGAYIRELPYDTNQPQYIELLQLPVGSYSVVSIANATNGHSALSSLAVQSSSAKDFMLRVVSPEHSGYHENSDELFFSTRNFTAKSGVDETYYCDLSNIHCHLKVKVKWHNIPPHNGNYELRLNGVATTYSLSPLRAYAMTIRADKTKATGFSTAKEVVHTFPFDMNILGGYEQVQALYNLELSYDLVTLRYTNNHIPILQLYYNGQPVSKKIDLARAFTQWGWFPNKHSEQIYKIQLELFDDGTVKVTQFADAMVSDWEDGGVIGVSQ